MSAAPLSLEALDGRLPGPADTLPRRRSALAAFAAAGWPTTRRETWRYTDLKPLAAEGLDLAPPPPAADAASAALALLETVALAEGEPRLVLVDGHRVARDAAPALPGLTVRDLDEHWRGDADPGALAAAHPLAALNAAFTRGGVALEVAPGARVPAVHIVLVGSGRPGLAPQPRIRLDVGAGGEITVVQHLIDAPDSAGWLNSVIEISLAADARAALYRVQEHAPAQSHTALVKAALDARAELTACFVDLGGRLVRNDVEVALNAPGARADLFGVLLAGAGQHVDDHLLVDHVAPETRSEQTFRGIIGRRGRGVFNGKVVVHRDAQRVDARQSNDNLLLADNAEIDTKPELEIYADDVKCSHGSTVGELDEQQLFYLRSRGIDADAARDLLTTAFAAAVLERLPDPRLRERVASRVVQRLRAVAEALP